MENNNFISQQPSNQVRENTHDVVNGNRPVSCYDNTVSDNAENSAKKKETKVEYKFGKNPSQMHCLVTTVPQNIASQNIAGKHTPTRNSLRHSRMIGLNKTGQASTQSPPLIKYYKFVKTLLILITFLGTVLSTLSLLLLLWTPNIRSRDNPYWSAVPIIFSGIIGLIFLNCFPKKRSNTRLNFWIGSIKLLSISASSIAAAASFTMCVLAEIHLVALTTMTCSPPDKVNTTCLCRTDPSKQLSPKSYHYVDLSCTEVNNILYYIILFTCIINAIVGLLEILYLYFHWASRNSYRYSRVQTTNNLDKTNKSDR